LGYPLVVINPIQTDAFRKFSIRKAKTDPIDSKLIANIMRTHNYKRSSYIEENIFSLRQLSRYRLSLVDNCSDLKRQTIALLDQVFPEYDKQFSDVFGVTSKQLLSKCPTPEDILAISTKNLSKLLNINSHGRFGSEKALKLKESAQKPLV
jgi:transposase